jgi:hypothetical protein
VSIAQIEDFYVANSTVTALPLNLSIAPTQTEGYVARKSVRAIAESHSPLSGTPRSMVNIATKDCGMALEQTAVALIHFAASTRVKCRFMQKSWYDSLSG